MHRSIETVCQLAEILPSAVADSGQSAGIDLRGYEGCIIGISILGGGGGTVRLQTAAPNGSQVPSGGDYANEGATLVVPAGNGSYRIKVTTANLSKPFLRFIWNVSSSPGVTSWAVRALASGPAGNLNEAFDLEL